MSSSISGRRDRVTRRQVAGGLAALLACARATPSPAAERQVRFGVFSLFEPGELTLKADRPLLLRVSDRYFSLSPDDVPVCIRSEGDDIRIIFGAQTVTASRLRVTSP